ncbi:MAG: transporter, partial [Syntrophobacteraceae bacterium CG23_combo_of_CG06-09_8_20_14_all_50_8]
MKKKNVVIHFLMLLMLIATFVACASTPKHEGTG